MLIEHLAQKLGHLTKEIAAQRLLNTKRSDEKMNHYWPRLVPENPEWVYR
jgi:hypothetical protein